MIGSGIDGDASSRGDDIDLVTVGETMGALVRGEAAGCYRATPIGAESNVAVGMAQLGCRTRWISRLGDDEIGRFVAEFVAGHGVEVDVDWDPCHVTGLCTKEFSPAGTRVRYYRSQSAARHLNETHLARLAGSRWVHVTGVTAALSPSCLAMVSKIVQRRKVDAGRVSFDVNYRPALWSAPDHAAATLLPLARAADTVFIGDDEARVLLGSSDEAEVRRLILTRDDQAVVLKRGPGEASVVTLTDSVSEPALAAPVVDVTGAGDAFAAGYLAASLWGWQPAERLRLGHAMAARVVGLTADLAPNLDRSETERLIASVRRPSHDGDRPA
jgi:2-dehydro-3-deoxygluconokinase